MNYFVMLHGAHWRDISPDTFDAHKVPEYSTVLCDSFDMSGSLIEFKRGDMKFVTTRDAFCNGAQRRNREICTCIQFDFSLRMRITSYGIGARGQSQSARIFLS
jgi:hypothetical protein